MDSSTQRTQAYALIDALSDDSLEIIIALMRKLANPSAHIMATTQNNESMSQSINSLKALQSLNIQVPDDFDETRELMEGLDEKYHTA